MRRARINWQGTRPLDRYEKHEAFLWGALSALHPTRRIRPPLHPDAQREYFDGQTIAAGGYIRMAADADPREIVRRIKLDHILKRQEMAAKGGAA